MKDPNFQSTTTPLTIDTHAHIFNGSDIPIASLFKRVMVPHIPLLGELGGTLQWLGWRNAPDASEELAALQTLQEELLSCGPSASDPSPLVVSPEDTFRVRYQVDRDAQYEVGRRELQLANELYLEDQVRNPPAGPLPAGNGITSRLIAELPSSYDEYARLGLEADVDGVEPAVAAASVNIGGAVDFVLKNFNYRYVNMYNYLDLYSKGSNRKIDLAAVHLLDFDWPLGNTQGSPSSIRDQVKVMSEISRLTGGIAHSFVPFDPFRWVAVQEGLVESEDPLETLRWAADNGAIGSKIYPPMGFAPMGNREIHDRLPDFWDKPWLPDQLRSLGNLGERLDNAMGAFYDACLDLDFPIMAHTNRSMFPKTFEMTADDPRQFGTLIDPKFWQLVPSGLRVHFGHFGGGVPGNSRDDSFWVDAYADLMTTESGSHGEHFYAGTGHDVRPVSEPGPQKLGLTKLYNDHAGDSEGAAALEDRLMYASDWYMLVALGDDSIEGYFQSYQDIYQDLDLEFQADPTLSDRFFGRNAAVYLGLSGSANRDRLDLFHNVNDATSEKPNWMLKVDALA